MEDLPFASRIEPWRRDILRYAHRLTGDPDLAEDVAQEALMRMLASDVHAMRNPRAWLYSVATNLLRDRARRNERERRLSIPVNADAPPNPDQDLDRRETIACVRAVLEALPPRDRELLILRESGFRYREIADVIGLKTESVPVLMARALARFRAAYLAEARDETPP